MMNNQLLPEQMVSLLVKEPERRVSIQVGEQQRKESFLSPALSLARRLSMKITGQRGEYYSMPLLRSKI